MTEEKKIAKTIPELYSILRKAYGEKSVLWASDIPPYEVVSTGSLAVDYAIGIGGVPTNRVIELSGENSTGKTTLALHTVNNFLMRYPDRGAVFLDCENRLTPDWVARFIKDMDRLIVVKPDSMEQATDMYRAAVVSGKVSIAVLDSIGGAPTQRVTNKSSEIGNMGGNSLAVTAFATFAQTLSGKYNCCTIGINQVREDFSGYHTLVTPGGKGWKHACSLRINLKMGDQKFMDKINGETVQVGYSIVAKIVKNSLAPPHRLGWYCFYNQESKYGFGVDTVEETIRLGALVGVIEQRGGGWYYHESIPTGKIRGQAELLELVMKTPELKEKLVRQTLDKLSSGEASLAVTYDPDAEDSIVEPQLGLVRIND